jgi:L-methionine (R)-S-oxide reductase
MTSSVRQSVAAVLGEELSRQEKAQRIAGLVRQARNYRWVGLYDVTRERVSLLACDRPGAPAYPEFPVTQGLTGSAIQQKHTVVVGDVRTDPRYLTAFGSTLSEIIIPVLNKDVVVGTIDVESERANAFSAADQRLLESVARAAAPLWWNRR